MASIDSSSSNPPDPDSRVHDKIPVDNECNLSTQLTKDDLTSAGVSMSMSGDHPGECTPPSIVIGPAGDATSKRVTTSQDSPRSASMDSPRATDCQSVDTRLSGVSGESCRDSLTDSQPTSARGRTSTSPLQRGKDPARREKEKEREERVRHARERMEAERKRKFEELKEQQRIAQENRERQLEMRRHRIEELRRRETERRIAVEDRRRQQEEQERIRRESIVQKSQERVARYEQWKNSGRSGGSGHYLGFGSRTPRDICRPVDRPLRSASHSALVRRSPNGSDWDYVRPQRRAQSACSTVRRHCCVDTNRSGPCPWAANPPSKHMSMSMSVLYHKRNPEFASSGMLNSHPESVLALNSIPEGRRSFLAPSSAPSQRTKSATTVTSGGQVKLRENKTPRKARPSSVATSMPTFVVVERQSPRSKSTDRLSRDRQEKSKQQRMSRKSLPATPTQATREGSKEGSDGGERETKTSAASSKVNRETIERLSMPKHVRNKVDGKDKPEAAATQATSKTDTVKNTSRLAQGRVPRKAYSTTNLSTITRKPVIKQIHDRPKLKESKPSLAPGTPSATPPAVATAPSTTAADPPSVEPTPAAMVASTPAVCVSDATPVSKAPDTMSRSMTDVSRSAQDISVLTYKAKLAEHRRLAREKAEREQELERQRQEQERLVEEERQRQEEEEQRRQEEELLRLAADAKLIEEERLATAIAAEEQRRREEAERMEAEKIARQEAELKAREEAERLERDRIERKQREEEERLERKKRLEMIMKRVKTDGTESPKTQSPAKSMNSSPSKSGDSSTESSADDAGEETMTTVVTTSGAVTTISTVVTSDDKSGEDRGVSRVGSPPPDKLTESASTPRFHSPLLQQLVQSKSTENLSSERPKFKSPILQTLLGKNKLRKVEDKEEKSVIFSLDKDVEKSKNMDNPPSVGVIDSMASVGVIDSTASVGVKDEDKDVDTSESQSASPASVTNSGPVIGQHTGDSPYVVDMDKTATEPPAVVDRVIEHGEMSVVVDDDLTLLGNGVKPDKSLNIMESMTSSDSTLVNTDSSCSDSQAGLGNGVQGGQFDPFTDLVMTSSNLTDEDKTMKCGADSGILVDLATSGSSLTAVNGFTHNGMLQASQDLVDSSISMRSVDSLSGSVSDNKQFEEIIDLSSVSNKSAPVQLNTQENDTRGDKCEDLLNLNNLDGPPPTPIIAFEEKTAVQHDVPDLLS